MSEKLNPEMDLWSADAVRVARAKTVARALRGLAACGLKPPFDVDASDMVVVWTAALEDYDPAFITRAATALGTDSDHYPTLHEFIEAVRECERDSAKRHDVSERWICPSCHGTGFLQASAADDPYRSVAPCHECNPLQEAKRQWGHYYDAQHICSIKCPGWYDDPKHGKPPADWEWAEKRAQGRVSAKMLTDEEYERTGGPILTGEALREKLEWVRSQIKPGPLSSALSRALNPEKPKRKVCPECGRTMIDASPLTICADCAKDPAF